MEEPEAEKNEKENGEVKGTVQNDMEVALEELTPEVMGFETDFGSQGPANNNMPVVSGQGREYPAQLITPPGNLMGNPAVFQGPPQHFQPPPPPFFNGPNQYWQQPSPHYHNQGVGINVASLKNDITNEVSQLVRTQIQELGQELKSLIKNQDEQEVKSNNESKKTGNWGEPSLWPESSQDSRPEYFAEGFRSLEMKSLNWFRSNAFVKMSSGGLRVGRDGTMYPMQGLLLM